MVSFLFWNLEQIVNTFPVIGRLAERRPIDVFFLAECPNNIESITTDLNQRSPGSYRVADRSIITKVRVVSRLPKDDFFPHFNNQPGDLTIWKLVRAAPQRTET
jgi:hypothetical protein